MIKSDKIMNLADGKILYDDLRNRIEQRKICYFCSNGEYNPTTRVPTILNPNKQLIYVVPSSDTSNSDLFIEWIYTNSGWERFGSAAIDIENKADKTDTILLTTLSRGRAANSTVGAGSIAWGNGVVASGDVAFAMGNGATASGGSAFAMGNAAQATGPASQAFGMGTQATGTCAHAEGAGSQATGADAHAEGGGTWASATCSHAEGGGTTASAEGAHSEGGGTIASGRQSHAEGSSCHASGDQSHAEGDHSVAGGRASHASGIHTSAEGTASFAFGMYNKEDSASNIPTWEPNHSPSYKYGEIVKRVVDGNTIRSMCINPNSSSEFDDSDWFTISEIGKFAEIVGNGYTISDEGGDFYVYSNARALDWIGNEYLMGDLYVGCGANSTGGTKIVTYATDAQTQAIITEYEGVSA